MSVSTSRFRWNSQGTKLYLNASDRSNLAVVFEEAGGWRWTAWPAGNRVTCPEAHATVEQAADTLLAFFESVAG